MGTGSIQAMGPAAAPAAAALARKLGDASLEYTMAPVGTGHVAAYILGQIGAPAVPALIECSRAIPAGLAAGRPRPSPRSGQRPKMPSPHCGAIGPEARAAVPALVEALNDPNSFFAAEVGHDLLHIDLSRRGPVEARLVAIPVGENTRYARAILTGALGRRSPEADEYTHRSSSRSMTHWRNGRR